MVFRIEQIEDIELRREASILIARLQIDQGGRLGTHAIVFNERPWAEVAEPETAEQAVGHIDRGPRGNHRFNGAWNMVASRVIFGKLRIRMGQVEIQGQPGERLIKIGPLYTIPTAGAAWLGDPRIPDKDQFRVQR